MTDTSLLDALLKGLAGRKGASCALRRAQQAAYAPGTFVKHVRTSFFPVHMDLRGTLRPGHILDACNLDTGAAGGTASGLAEMLSTCVLDPKLCLSQVAVAQQTAINSKDPPKPYLYASQEDYATLHAAMTELLDLVDSIKCNLQLKDLAFNFSTGTTELPVPLMASLQEMRAKLGQLKKFRDTIEQYRTAASDLDAILEKVPRLDPLLVPMAITTATNF